MLDGCGDWTVPGGDPAVPGGGLIGAELAGEGAAGCGSATNLWLSKSPISSCTSLALSILVSTMPVPSSSIPTLSAFANASLAFSISDFGFVIPPPLRTRSRDT